MSTVTKEQVHKERRQEKGLVNSRQDQAGQKPKEPAAVTFPLAGRALGLPHLHRSYDSGHLVELMPDPARQPSWPGTLLRTAAALSSELLLSY